MKVLVFGAAGKTGSLVVERAKEAGHDVSVFVHEGSEGPAGTNVLHGDVTNARDVRRAVAGQDAVIDTIGGKTPYKVTELESVAAENIVDSMQREGARRLVVVSMLGMGDSAEDSPFWYHHLMMPTFLRGARKDKAEMEREVEASGLEFVIARPPRLKDDPAKGHYVVADKEHADISITRADLAQFLVDSLTSDVYVGQAVVVANAKE